ncbi:MAG: hypothetical protein LBP40_04880 [Campylobacteraceae bacterium]|jgi:hypothetical protein|nr:hypothetical protein [Campylobacteraceae bacterium]
MSKTGIAILSAAAILLSACGQPAIPVKDEQTKGVYKIYYPSYFMYDIKMLDALLDTLCKDDACRQDYKNKPAGVTYVHLTSDGKCKTLSSNIKNDEISEIAKLEQQKEKDCSFVEDIFNTSWYYRANTALVWFVRNKNGDFINSEFLTLKDGKVTDRKLIKSTKTTTLYDKNGSKLLNKAHEDIYFYPETCNKVFVVDGLKYEILPLSAKKTVNPSWSTADKSAEKLLHTKFYLDNKNSSILKTFTPFGYMMEYGENFVDIGKFKRKVKVHRLFDENGQEVFDNLDLTGAVKINNSRMIVHAIKPYTSELEAFLYDFDNKKVLLEAERIKPDYERGMTQYDKIIFFKDKKSGIANFDGNIVMDLQDKYSFENTYKGFVTYTDGTGIYTKGVLDTKLNPLIKELSKVDFRDDVFIAHAKGRIVVFDYSKNILKDLKADNMTVYDDFYVVSSKKENTLYNKAWNKLFDKSYKDLKPLDNNTFSYTFKDKKALMDINGKEIIPPICDNIKLGSCGTIECVNADNKN